MFQTVGIDLPPRLSHLSRSQQPELRTLVGSPARTAALRLCRCCPRHAIRITRSQSRRRAVHEDLRASAMHELEHCAAARRNAESSDSGPAIRKSAARAARGRAGGWRHCRRAGCRVPVGGVGLGDAPCPSVQESAAIRCALTVASYCAVQQPGVPRVHWHSWLWRRLPGCRQLVGPRSS